MVGCPSPFGPKISSVLSGPEAISCVITSLAPIAFQVTFDRTMNGGILAGDNDWQLVRNGVNIPQTPDSKSWGTSTRYDVGYLGSTTDGTITLNYTAAGVRLKDTNGVELADFTDLPCLVV